MGTTAEGWLQTAYPEMFGDWRDAYCNTRRPREDLSAAAALCRICNLRTHTGLHYGVYSCEADKQFLKRTFHDMITYSICDMQCPPRSRGWCQYCRLRSSLLTGINLKMIRMGNNALKQGRAPRQKKPKAKAPKTSLKVEPMSEQGESPTVEFYDPASEPSIPTSQPSSVKEEVDSTQAWSRPVPSHEYGAPPGLSTQQYTSTSGIQYIPAISTQYLPAGYLPPQSHYPPPFHGLRPPWFPSPAPDCAQYSPPNSSLGIGSAYNPVQPQLGPLHDLANHASPHPAQQHHHSFPQQPQADPIPGQLATRFYPAGSQPAPEDTKQALARQPWSGLSPATEAAQRLLSGPHVVHQAAEQQPGQQHHPAYPLRHYSHYDVWRHHYLGYGEMLTPSPSPPLVVDEDKPLDLSSPSSCSQASSPALPTSPSSKGSPSASRPPSSASRYNSPDNSGLLRSKNLEKSFNKLSVNSAVLQEALSMVSGCGALMNLSRVSDVLTD